MNEETRFFKVQYPDGSFASDDFSDGWTGGRQYPSVQDAVNYILDDANLTGMGAYKVVSNDGEVMKTLEKPEE